MIKQTKQATKTKIIILASVMYFYIFVSALTLKASNLSYLSYTSGEFRSNYFKIKTSKVNKQSEEQEGIYNNIEFNFKGSIGNFNYGITPYLYIYETNDAQMIKNTNYTDAFPKQDIFFRNLYMSYNANNIIYGIGIIPMGNGFPIRFTKDYIKSGEGIVMLSDINPLSAFVKFKSDKSSYIGMISSLDTGELPAGMYLDKSFEKGSYGFCIVHTYKNHKIEIKEEILYTDIKYKGSDYATEGNMGIGISYDDSIDTGLSLYGVLGGSYFKNKSSNVKDEMLQDFNVPDIPQTQFMMNFDENKNYYGAATLIGFRKDFDIGKHDSFINMEWFHTFGDWTSGNQGAPYTNNCNQIANIRDNSYFINFGFIPRKDILIGINYVYMEFNDVYKIGGIDDIPVEDSLGQKIYKREIIRTYINCRF